MKSSDIRKGFLDFFAGKKHAVVASSSLMPDAPNLLFTNAGMNQFVPIFLSQKPCPYSPGRAADTQKCIRAGGKHNDLEDVGLDTYHHTFFEMLGNWSFGDYFKKEAIGWAWELLVGKWNFPPERLYATVYKPGEGDPAEFDQEAYDCWKAIFLKAGLDPDVHIVNGNKKDNFWMMGETGPCGPCSEVHVDLTPAGDTRGSLVNRGDSRCIEIWNLVFIQFNATPAGAFLPLPAKHVDTGMGFERVCSIIQGTRGFTDFKNANISNYNTDVFSPIFGVMEKMCGQKYQATLPAHGAVELSATEKNDVAFRVVADHIRTLTFAISDGIQPSNEGRGYVLRRILRRAVRYGRNLGFHEPFLHKLVSVVADNFGDVFPETREKCSVVERIIRAEEENFGATLDRGIELFHGAVARLKKGEPISGETAFELADTYGFPLDLTQLMARELGITVDEDGFQRLLEEQRKRSQSAQKKEVIEVCDADMSGFEKTVFVGFDQLETTAELLSVQQSFVIADKSPFYAEMGGQVGDTGTLQTASGKIYKVLDTQKTAQGVFLHRIEQTEGLFVGDKVVLKVDAARRSLIEGHHTATHVMHWALRLTLGDTVGQKGSYVGPDRLRFDFSHHEGMTLEEIEKVERMVNEKIRTNDGVRWDERQYSEVKGDRSVLQFFGEKYGESVRVVDIGGYSKELCGGTHARETGALGYFKLTSEGAIAAGVRRVEAVVGEALWPFIEQERQKTEEHHGQLVRKGASRPLSEWKGSSKEDALACLREWAAQINEMESVLREEEKQRAKEEKIRLQAQAAKQAEELLQKHAGASAFAESLPESDGKVLQAVADILKTRFKGAFVLGGVLDGKASLIACAPQPSKHHAGKIIQSIAPVVGGKGGGRPDMAQGGGSDGSKMDEAMQKARGLMA